MENTVGGNGTPQDEIKYGWMIAFMLMFILFAVSCNTPHRLANRLARTKEICDRHSDTAWSMLPVKTCISWFPQKPLRPGRPVIIRKTDTVTTEGPTVYADCSEAVLQALDEAARSHVAVKCPPTRTITVRDTVRITDTINDVQAEHLLTLRIAALQTDNGNMAAKITQVTSQSGNRLKWAIGEGIALLAVLFLFGLGVAGKLSKIV